VVKVRLVSALFAPGSQLNVVLYVAIVKVKSSSGAFKSSQFSESAVIPEPEIVPEQVRFPLLLVTVQPVEPDPPAINTSPVPVLFRFNASLPFASIERAMFVSLPVAANVTTPPAAAFVMVISSTAEAVVPKRICSFPLVSKISPPVSFKSPVTPKLSATFTYVEFEVSVRCVDSSLMV